MQIRKLMRAIEIESRRHAQELDDLHAELAAMLPDDDHHRVIIRDWTKAIERIPNAKK